MNIRQKSYNLINNLPIPEHLIRTKNENNILDELNLKDKIKVTKKKVLNKMVSKKKITNIKSKIIV